MNTGLHYSISVYFVYIYMMTISFVLQLTKLPPLGD